MQKLLSLAALCAVAPVLQAQHCTGTPPSTSLATVVPFSATHYVGSPNPLPPVYNGPVVFMDLTVEANLSVSQIDLYLYDDGLVNVNQVGFTSTSTVYTCPTSRRGNELLDPAVSGSPWTAIGTGTLTVANSNSHSPIVFNPPLALPAGTYGIAIGLGVTNSGLGTPPGSLHTLVTLPSAQPNTPLRADDQYLHITAQSGSRNAWVSGVGADRTENLEYHYTPDPSSAFSEPFGVGCYDNAPSFYEAFPVPPAAFDLSNRSIHMFPLTDRYLVTPGTGVYAPPPGTATLLTNATNAPMGDDDVSAAITLPWAFNWIGGSTNDIVVGSNCHVWLSAVSGGSFGYYDNNNGFLTGGARLAPCYGDQNPDFVSNGGVTCGVYYEAGATSVKIWWNAIPEWVPTPPSTGIFNVMCEIFQSGEIEYTYGTCAMQNAPVLVGFTPGTVNVSDPTSRNLSTLFPGNSFNTGDGFQPPFLALDRRPVLGRTVNIQTTTPSIPAAFGILLLSFGELPGIDLSYISPGLAGCKQWISPAGLSSNGAVYANNLLSVPLTIPNQPIFAGVTVFCQSAIICGCQNAAGIVVSNGMCLKVGQN